MAEMEPLLEKMKLKREEEGLRSQALEMELNEDLENLELLLEETKLEERHVAKVKRFIMKARKIKSVREESKTKSATLEMQFDKRREEFGFLFYEMKFLRWSEERWQMQFKMQHEAKLEFLLKGIELKQEEERLPSRELEMELEELELLVKEIESERHVEVPESLALKMQLEGHLGKVKSVLEAMKMEHEKENPELPAMKEQLKERVVRVKDIIFPPSKRSSIKNLTEDIKELKSLQQKLILLQFTEEIKSQMLKMELERYTGELESLEEEIELEEFRLLMLEFEYSERHGQKWWETHIQKSWGKHYQKSSETHIKKSWETHIQKSESLLNKLESECNEKILQPLVWKMILKGHTATQKRKLEFPTLVTEKHIAKLESLMVEMKLEQEEGLEFQMLDIKLKEHILKSELLVTETKLLCDVYMQQSSVSKMQLEENLAKVKSRLEITKLEREKREAKFIALQTMLKQEKEKLESLTEAMKYTPRGQDGLNKLIEPRHIIVIGGRRQYGQSLKAVEGYVFFEGRWIELPAMTTPRSFMSSVVVGQEIIVSGGDTGDAITDTIEVLNLAETPLQWKISPVKLPVPLSAHQTVVYRGKLIVIGGHDGNEGRNSDKIYEILLTPPYSIKILKNLVSPVAWHGAELVGHEIIILGGGSTPFVATSAVFAYNLVRNTLHKRKSLPRAVKGMGTVTRAMRVAVIGGLDDNDQELDEVFMYDPWSGERHMLPQMNNIRGPCSAVFSLTLDTSGSCSSDASSNTLVVLGCPSNPNTVEGCNFDSRTWKAMPPTIEAREFCSVVATPIEFKLG